MVFFHTKIANFGIFLKALGLTFLAYFVAFWYILECIRMENFGVSHGYLLYFMAIWYFCGHLVFMWPFGNFLVIWYFCGHFGNFFPFLFIVPRKIWQPCPKDICVVGTAAYVRRNLSEKLDSRKNGILDRVQTKQTNKQQNLLWRGHVKR
jgi:hypothetical protein